MSTVEENMLSCRHRMMPGMPRTWQCPGTAMQRTSGSSGGTGKTNSQPVFPHRRGNTSGTFPYCQNIAASGGQMVIKKTRRTQSGMNMNEAISHE